MDNYFYHGIEGYYGMMGEILQTMIKILKEGILVRNKVRNYDDSSFNHVCLYKKNDDYDYNQEGAILKSARSGWVDGCFVFIINPNIEARKAIVGKETDLIDEWRCDRDILVSDIVGIALPYSYIEEDLASDFEEDKDDLALLRQGLEEIQVIASELGIPIYDGSEKGFTDRIDSSNKKKMNV